MTLSFEPAPYDRRLATGARGLLAVANAAGHIEASDAHVAARLCALLGEPDDQVALALALTVRAAREGSTCLDLARARESVLPSELAASADTGRGEGTPPMGSSGTEHPDTLGLSDLPEPREWLAAVARSPLVTAGAVQVEHGRVYLDRYWREEHQIVADLAARAAHPVAAADPELVEEVMERVFAGDTWSEQREAVRVALSSNTTILTGGPGTGKTSTVAGLLTVLAEVHERNASAAYPGGARPLRVALAAPTGKAAARLRQSIIDRAGDGGFSDLDRARLQEVESTTVHRLLGWVPDSATRFRRRRGNPLGHDVVVIDEASMLSLTLTARLLEAIPARARLIIVGDPDQLASVEAGAVLADLVAGAESGGNASTPRVAALRTSHRFTPTIQSLADAVRSGDPEAVLALLRARDYEPESRSDATALTDPASATDRATASATANATSSAPASPLSAADRPHLELAADRQVGFVEIDADDPRPGLTAEQAIRGTVLAQSEAVRQLAVAGDGVAAVARLGGLRVLCAHRDGPWGVRTWNQRVERWLAESGTRPFTAGHAIGEPLLVTRNDPSVGVYNGDTGVVIWGAGGTPVVAFESLGRSPGRGRAEADGSASGSSGSDSAEPAFSESEGSKPEGVESEGSASKSAESESAEPELPQPESPQPESPQPEFPQPHGRPAVVTHPLIRLGNLETAHAMTVHKAQGSEADHVIVLLPDDDSALLTRELLYTAITRAKRRVTVVGTEAAVRRAVEHRTQRASGLQFTLGAAGPDPDQ